MHLNSKVTLNSLTLDGLIINRGELLEVYEAKLGLPDRCAVPPCPAPYGHRNNIIYFFDQLGVLLYEHHATYLINSMQFQLDPSGEHFPTNLAYSGELNVCGVQLYAGMRFSDFSSQCELEFKPHLGHAWYYDSEHIAIQFEVKKVKGNKDLKSAKVHSLCVGFRKANRLK